MLVHLGGLITVVPKVPLKTRDDLSMAYTPGVARVCQAIAADPATARNLTIKRNTVAVVTDGSAVLGLGDLGPAAALPVMEGKAALFQRFGGVDAWPVCIDSHDVDEIVRTVELIAPSYGGINLEDIAAPRCFVIERRLRAALDIPVFHDDQHGTAIVVLAGLLNALRVVGKELGDVRAVVLGIGAAGTAITRLLLAAGIGDVTAVDRQGILTGTTSGLDEDRAWVAAHTNLAGRTGTLGDAIEGADVLVGVSGPGLVSAEHLSSMREGAVVFALANPDPEVQPAIARRHAAVVATGRSDQPNQINNVLVFPGFFRGLLRSGARTITEEMELAAARALAGVVGDNERSATYIVPSVFNPAVVPAVSDAVEAAARRSTGATAP
jgi:malate dehydrogenase (oxaloacetate-decarboxylating)